MATTINLNDQQTDLVRTILGSQQEQLIVEISDLIKQVNVKEKQYKDNESLLKQLSITNSNEPDANNNSHFMSMPSNFKEGQIITKQNGVNGYDPNMSSWKKAVYVLNEQNKVMTARELIEAIYNLEPELKNVPREVKQQFEDNIFANLNRYTNTGEVRRFKNIGDTQYKYGFKNWFNDNAEVKQEYLV